MLQPWARHQIRDVRLYSEWTVLSTISSDCDKRSPCKAGSRSCVHWQQCCLRKSKVVKVLEQGQAVAPGQWVGSAPICRWPCWSNLVWHQAVQKLTSCGSYWLGAVPPWKWSKVMNENINGFTRPVRMKWRRDRKQSNEDPVVCPGCPHPPCHLSGHLHLISEELALLQNWGCSACWGRWNSSWRACHESFPGSASWLAQEKLPNCCIQ